MRSARGLVLLVGASALAVAGVAIRSRVVWWCGWVCWSGVWVFCCGYVSWPQPFAHLAELSLWWVLPALANPRLIM